MKAKALKAPFDLEWMMVTPELAKQWLEKNTKNRALRMPTVASYARDMTAGEWLPNHQGIAFAQDGRLLDGQHRLAAIVRSGKSLPMLVCTNVPDRCEGAKGAVMDTVDRGATRSIPDILRLQHGMKTDANMVTAAGLIVAQICVSSPEAVKRASVAQVLAVLEPFREGLKFVCENRPRVPGIRSATCCGAIALAYEADPAATREFYQRFAQGTGLAEGDAVLVVRNYFLSNPPRGSANQRALDAELLIYCIGAHRAGRGFTRLPKIAGREGARWALDLLKEKAAAVRATFLTRMWRRRSGPRRRWCGGRW